MSQDNTRRLTYPCDNNEDIIPAVILRNSKTANEPRNKEDTRNNEAHRYTDEDALALARETPWCNGGHCAPHRRQLLLGSSIELAGLEQAQNHSRREMNFSSCVPSGCQLYREQDIFTPTFKIRFEPGLEHHVVCVEGVRVVSPSLVEPFSQENDPDECWRGHIYYGKVLVQAFVA